MKKTKEDLIIELARIQQSYGELKEKDLKYRMEFARGFDWKKNDFYSSKSETYEPSWIEIFIELGKLLNNKDLSNMQTQIFSIESSIKTLNQDLYNSLVKKEY